MISWILVGFNVMILVGFNGDFMDFRDLMVISWILMGFNSDFVDFSGI